MNNKIFIILQIYLKISKTLIFREKENFTSEIFKFIKSK